jgi:hypothetical protein
VGCEAGRVRLGRAPSIAGLAFRKECIAEEILRFFADGLRRECLDHVIVWNERSLRRTLHNYFAYYQRSRTHLALGKDAPEPRAVEPPEQGRVVAIPQVEGLHHRYQRCAA